MFLCFLVKSIKSHKILDPRNNHEKKILGPQNTHEKKFWTHEILTRKSLGPTKYPRGNILEPRWHDVTRPTRPMIAQDPRNLAHSISTPSTLPVEDNLLGSGEKKRKTLFLLNKEQLSTIILFLVSGHINWQTACSPVILTSERIAFYFCAFQKQNTKPSKLYKPCVTQLSLNVPSHI